MSGKTNGSKHNGADGHNDEESGIVRFPTFAKRDRLHKQKLREEREQKRVPETPPFLNLAKLPPFTRFIAGAFIAVHIVIFLGLNAGDRLQAFYTLGFVPGYFTGALGGFPWFAPLGIVTHMFIHGGWMHLAFNTIMALSMGMFFERSFGTRTAVFFFFVCGIAGALVYLAFNPFSTVPVIGASGSLSGLFGAAIILIHRHGDVPGTSRRGPWRLVAFWMAFMVLSGLAGGGGLAWQAHVGGFLTGIALFHLMEKGKLKL